MPAKSRPPAKKLLDPEYTAKWIHKWFDTICKRFGWMVIASHYKGNDLKLKAYLEEIGQLQRELGRMGDDRDAAIMLRKLAFVRDAAESLSKA